MYTVVVLYYNVYMYTVVLRETSTKDEQTVGARQGPCMVTSGVGVVRSVGVTLVIFTVNYKHYST